MSSWKTIAKRTNSLPPGWSSPDEIAADLDCEIAEVPKILAAAHREGLVERQNFPHYQEGSRQLLYITGYRQIKPGTKPATPTASITGIPDDLLPKVRQKIAEYPNKTAGAIRDLFSTNNRRRLSTAAIRSILGR
jgi:hypothetical protein